MKGGGSANHFVFAMVTDSTIIVGRDEITDFGQKRKDMVHLPAIDVAAMARPMSRSNSTATSSSSPANSVSDIVDLFAGLNARIA